MVMPLTIIIITSCAIFSLDQKPAVGVGVTVGVRAAVGCAVGVTDGNEPGKIIGVSSRAMVGVGIGVLYGVGVRTFSVTTIVYWQ